MQIRDLVHVSDIVAATRLAMEAERAPGNAFNVATGRRMRIGELAGQLCERLAPELEPEITGEFRAGDIRHCFADTSKARELLGFGAEVPFERGLPELLEWVGGQVVEERGDEALASLRRAGLVG
jgi:dTDP-L-rhamnose 4-epimerase